MRDELLEQLNYYRPERYVEYSQALRAVVELHKPVGISWDNDNLSCDECADIYPCKTIQAIEKELQ